MRKLTILLAVIVISAAGIVVGTPKHSVDQAGEPYDGKQKANKVIVDGELTPEKIPDYEAYTILFRLIAKRETEDEKNHIRSYLRQVIACTDCTTEIAQADIDALIAVAEEFDQRVTGLDRQATEIQNRYHPDHPPVSYGDKEYLKHLQRQKESIADEVATSLRGRLSPDGLKNLRKHVKERMKPKMRMYKNQ